MSQHIRLGACQILRLSALTKACEHIEGAKLRLSSDATSFHGLIDISENPLLKGSRSSRMSTLFLTFVPHDGCRDRVPATDSQTGAITNGHIALSYDGDVHTDVERVVGREGSRLREYYNREVSIETLRTIYGEGVAFREWDEVVDGVVKPQLEAIAADETAEESSRATLIY